MQTLKSISLTALIAASSLCVDLPNSNSLLAAGGNASGSIEVDVRSEYSHIRVRKRGTVLSLVFVRDNGQEAVESMMNVSKPNELLVAYTRYMFTSYMLKPEHDRVLIVGLGAGSMVRFLEKHDPAVKVDAIEIDPEVVRIAKEHFGTEASENVGIFTVDGFEYLEKTDVRYDVIYMDAFLKPSASTDVNGLPLKLKTEKFYRSMQEKLTPNGVVVFNLNPHRAVREDVDTIRSAFGQVYVFRVANENYVAVATSDESRKTQTELKNNARAASRRLKAGFSLSRMLNDMIK